jgi:cyclopropane fatty-acyl-phospholipid synthase-like methyltransferase
MDNSLNQRTNKEQHYSEVIREVRSLGKAENVLGCGIAWAYYDDPKRLAFTFSRYKFASKMLSGCKKVLEVGCGDGFASRVLLQEVKTLTCTDIDDEFISDAINRKSSKWPIEFIIHDFIDGGPLDSKFDGAVCMDVIEHISVEKYDIFFQNICSSLSEFSTLVLGAPSLQSQEWASNQSKMGHVSCMNQAELKNKLQSYFRKVFMFSMNDEVVHTGFSNMAQYHIALCVL